MTEEAKMMPCKRCGEDHVAVKCPNRVRGWRAGDRVRHRTSGRLGTVMARPKWLPRHEMGTWVMWDDGLTPEKSLANPGWLRRA